ncbi:MAG: acetate kinase [Candidatus Omnitrophica bacterium]|nr:acetate kinase [Candidatus Omnitrophota bacterium]
MSILVINCGSSSVKYKLFEVPSFRLVTKGLIEKIGESNSACRSHYQAVLSVFSRIKSCGIDIKDISGIGHRVVHGGEKFKKPTLITSKVIKEIRKYSRLAPLHNPVNLAGILASRKVLSKVRQVAVFDTAFHQTIPKYAYIYGLPFEFYSKFKIRRYGFHGTSHQYVASRASAMLKKPLSRLKLITVHLGNGCSIAAVDRGRCIETSMGFTPLEGLIMGTRCGDIDPAVVFYMINRLGLSPSKIEDILNTKSGLLGISGLSNDIRMIKRAGSKRSLRARLCLDMFVYRIKKYIAAYAGILNEVQAVIFTAGIGENNPDIIKRITKDLGRFLKRKPRILTIPTDEELMIARLTCGKL